MMSCGSAGVSSRSRMPSSMNSVSVIPGCIFTYRSTCVYTSRGRRTETVTGFSASDSYANGLPRFAMVCFLLVQVVHLYYSITIIYYRWEWQEASDKMYYRNTLGCAGEEAHGGGMHLRAQAATPKFEAKRHGASEHGNNCVA